MLDCVTLARAAGPLSWSPQGETAVVRCPDGHETSLRGQTIDPDGAVPYLAICMAPGCRWAERVRLEGWRT